MAKPILVANWKNNPGSKAETLALLKELSKKREIYKKINLFIAPPYIYFDLVSSKISFAKLASQDFPRLKGIITGETASEMLKSFGVRLAIVGHSERRALGETDAEVAEKAKAALKSGVTPLICVGEKERDEEGNYFDFLRNQIKSSFAGLSRQAAASVILAYEPVWAIGKGAKDAIAPGDLCQTIIFIRKVLSDLFGRNAAESIKILYGGSVEPMNAGELMRESNIAGFLVGHASLKPKSFEQIALSLAKIVR